MLNALGSLSKRVTGAKSLYALSDINIEVSRGALVNKWFG